MKQSIIYSCVIFLFGLIISGCYKDVISPEIEYEPQAVSFSNELAPMFATKCTNEGCHVPGGHTPYLNDVKNSYKNIVGGNYINVLFPKESIFYKYVYGEMSEFTTKAERQKIYDWIRNGARNN